MKNHKIVICSYKNNFRIIIEKMKKFVFDWKRYFFYNLLFSCLLYFPIISQTLVNHYDGIWHNSYYQAGNWELSIGRWLLPYLDKLHFGIQSNLVNSIITLSLFIIAIIFIIQLFELRESKYKWVIGFFILSNPFISVILSYCFTAPAYGLSFLISITAAFVIMKVQKPRMSILVGGVCIAISLSCYQAFLGCTSIVILIYLLKSVVENEKYSSIIMNIGKAMGAYILGGGLYKIILSIILKTNNVNMAGYQNFSDLNIKTIIMSLPRSGINCYKEFGEYFFFTKFKHNILLQDHMNVYICLVLIIILTTILLALFVLRKNVIRIIVYVLLLALSPIACNVVLLIVTDSNVSAQMMGSLSLFLPLCIILIKKFDSMETDMKKNILVIMAIISGCMIYTNGYMTIIDQLAMKEGTIATSALSEQVLATLNTKHLLNRKNTYVFIGAPANNPIVYHSVSFYRANDYARFGEWAMLPDCTTMSWRGVLVNELGINLDLLTDEKKYTAITESKILKKMPVFPSSNAIVKSGNLIIIKISDNY